MKDIKLFYNEIEELFRDQAPVLVEVRKPASETIRNWYLVEAAASFWALVSNCPDGAEFFLLGVRGLDNVNAQLAGVKEN